MESDLTINKIIEFCNEWEQESAVVFGMVFQFFLLKRKTWKMAITIMMSAFFIALYFIPVIIELFNLAKYGNIAKMLYALSALLSIELLSLIITILPQAISLKFKKILGINNAS